MYLARFSYDIKPIDREHALGLLSREVAAARQQGLEARLLIPLTRAPSGGALQVEVLVPTLDRFETFREVGLGSSEETRAWMRELSQVLLEPPAVELLRVAETETESIDEET